MGHVVSPAIPKKPDLVGCKSFGRVRIFCEKWSCKNNCRDLILFGLWDTTCISSSPQKARFGGVDCWIVGCWIVGLWIAGHAASPAVSKKPDLVQSALNFLLGRRTILMAFPTGSDRKYSPFQILIDIKYWKIFTAFQGNPIENVHFSCVDCSSECFHWKKWSRNKQNLLTQADTKWSNKNYGT